MRKSGKLDISQSETSITTTSGMASQGTNESAGQKLIGHDPAMLRIVLETW
jgi:hypothetical protein